MTAKKKVNYLNNKDILKEIHKSKNSFCSFEKENDDCYDIIVYSLDDIDTNKIFEAKQNRAQKEENKDYEQRKQQGEKVKQADCKVDPNNIPTKGLTFRVMTFEHIPDEPGRKKTPKTTADTKIKLNFPPFQHWQFDTNYNLVCVGKSHWQGDIEYGEFCKTHGKPTEKLANMWMLLVNRCATKGNVRGYSYNEEMKGQALLQMTQIGLQFDESKSLNPFAYYTSSIMNSFIRVINTEKRNQNIRDDILEMNDLTPSHTRQHNSEWENALKRENQTNTDE